MTDTSTIRDLVQGIVSEAIDSHIRLLQDQIVSKVMAAVEPLSTDSGGSSTAVLRSAIGAIENATQQTDILVALLDGTASFCGRAALLILRGNAAVGWQARGFDNNEVIKTVTIDVSSGVIAGVVQQCAAALISPSQFDVRFFATFGAPLRDEAIVVPLIVRDKVAAVLYADCGSRTDGIDAAAVELVVRAAGSWIELHALRKAAGLPGPTPARAAQISVPQRPSSPTAPPSVSDEAPAATERLGSSENVEPASAPVSTSNPPADGISADHQDSASVTPTGKPEASSEPVSQSQPASADFTQVPTNGDDEELHRKARRFAKLLVDEIVLYNREKVTQGRLNSDLYDRLREDIDKSRSTYERRYGQTSAGSRNYFTQALITGLADSNATLLGTNFPG